MTNYERIKNMSVEEMARFIASSCCEELVNTCYDECCGCGDATCQGFLKEWLESEVTE